MIAGLASLVRPKGEPPLREVTAFTTVAVASILCFGMYTAVKAAYISTVFATLIVERNLIFLVPILFTGTALFLERRRARWWAVLAAGAFALYLVHVTPYSLTQYPNYEAHGLAIIALANRIFIWPASTIEHALITVTVVATAALSARPTHPPAAARGRGHRPDRGVHPRMDGHDRGLRRQRREHVSKNLYAILPKPANWLDLTTQQRGTVFLGQAIRDVNPINLLEFWNGRSPASGRSTRARRGPERRRPPTSSSRTGR